MLTWAELVNHDHDSHVVMSVSRNASPVVSKIMLSEMSAFSR